MFLLGILCRYTVASIHFMATSSPSKSVQVRISWYEALDAVVDMAKAAESGHFAEHDAKQLELAAREVRTKMVPPGKEHTLLETVYGDSRSVQP